MRTDIDAVFTDFGGVLLHLDFERCFDAFHRLGAETPKEILFKSPEFVRLMRNLETGQIDDDDFSTVYEIYYISEPIIPRCVRHGTRSSVPYPNIN